MKKISKKELENKLNFFINQDAKFTIKALCLDVIFKKPLSLKKYQKFIQDTFDLYVSIKEINEWKVEYENDLILRKQLELTSNENFKKNQT